MLLKTINDKKYYVISQVPVVKSMVLNGALLTTDEIKKTLPAWNMKPVVLGHPEENGQKVSASLESQLRHHVGFITNAKLDQDRMRADLYLDADRLKTHAAGPKLMGLIEAGQPIDVSTAYFDHGSLDENGIKEGKAYESIHQNIAPDHLAVLLDEDGACRPQDGCGINVNCQCQPHQEETEQQPGESKMTESEHELNLHAKGIEAHLKEQADSLKTIIEQLTKLSASLEAKPIKAHDASASGGADGEDDDEELETLSEEKAKRKTKLKTHAVDYEALIPNPKQPLFTSWETIFRSKQPGAQL